MPIPWRAQADLGEQAAQEKGGDGWSKTANSDLLNWGRRKPEKIPKINKIKIQKKKKIEIIIKKKKKYLYRSVISGMELWRLEVVEPLIKASVQAMDRTVGRETQFANI